MSSPSKNIRLVLALNVFWYTFMILLGWVLHRNEVVGYVFPLIILTLLGGAFLGMWMFNCLTRSALPVSIKENQFKKGSFIEHPAGRSQSQPLCGRRMEDIPRIAATPCPGRNAVSEYPVAGAG